MSTSNHQPVETVTLADRLARFERWGLALGVATQLGVLIGMIVMRVIVLWTGQVYHVRVEPVDPRDFLRGDYVILSYQFSRLPFDPRFGKFEKAGFGDIRELKGREIYVQLAPEGDGKHWHAVEYSLEPPAKEPYLKGKINDFGLITYGIESFYVQEGTGHAFEDAARSRRLTAEIAVRPNGEAALRKLHIDK